MLSFDWDEAKASSNERKHGVSFHEACSVFYDESALQFFDETHSKTEVRYLMLGISSLFRLLIVVYCERDQGQTIRIISARRASDRESRHYVKAL